LRHTQGAIEVTEQQTNTMNQLDTKEVAALLREGLQNGRPSTITVTSNSMSPLLQAGDNIVVSAAAANQLQAGDIIIVNTDKGFLTHRFWGFATAGGQAYLLTRGDKPWWFDPPSLATNLLGRVTARLRHNRILALDMGWGLWLNRHLARLAAFENRFVVGTLVPTDGNKSPTTNGAMGKRGVHLVIYGWAKLVTAVITPLAETPFQAID
jgi:signal peptidase I